MPRRGWLALRGAGAVVVAAAIAVALIARATGHLDRTNDVYVGIPVSAGLITSQSPVRYHGVNVGRISTIESGSAVSRVRLAINSDVLQHIPSSVVARVVPRTFFGDIYLRLIDPPGSRSARPLTGGSTISVDRSPDAMALYDMFTKIVTVFSQVRPERMQTALTAISQALRGRGREIGATIDNLSVSADTLAPSLSRLLDDTPQFRDVMVALHTATPDILHTLSAATSVSDRMVHDRAFAPALDAVARLGGLLTGFVNDNRQQLITVLDAAGKILATTAANPDGLRGTLSGAESFGAAGARVFSTGKFSITAVATFAGPMPYTMADCPQYGSLSGAHCAASGPALVPTPRPADPLSLPAADLPLGPSRIPGTEASDPPAAAAEPPAPEGVAPAAPAAVVVDPDRQDHTLAVLQNHLLPQPNPTDKPNIATVVMLGPLVQGTEVRIR